MRQKKCEVIHVVIPALLKLVLWDGHTRSSSLADEFELILKEDGICKTCSIYKEWYFTKSWHTAGTLLDCIPQFKKLVDCTNKCNLLTGVDCY